MQQQIPVEFYLYLIKQEVQEHGKDLTQDLNLMEQVPLQEEELLML